MEPRDSNILNFHITATIPADTDAFRGYILKNKNIFLTNIQFLEHDIISITGTLNQHNLLTSTIEEDIHRNLHFTYLAVYLLDADTV